MNNTNTTNSVPANNPANSPSNYTSVTPNVVTTSPVMHNSLSKTPVVASSLCKYM